jgi:Ca-activated chloride channel homolog
VRRVLRGRDGTPGIGVIGRPALLAAVLATMCGASLTAADEPRASIQLTSPLGRSNLPGKVRIVARVTAQESETPPHVRFFVGDELLATDTDGPPYATEWVDDNPFELRRIRVEMDDGAGGVLADHVDLKPFEVVEAAEVMSVAVDASVRDGKGRYPGHLTKDDFNVFEDDSAQVIDAVASEAIPTTFALLVDSSQSMARNIEFVRQSVADFPRLLAGEDEALVAPFRQTITSVTGPTRDAATLADAVAAIRPSGGTAIMDGLNAVARRFGDGAKRRAVILITDGYDENSESGLDDALAALKAADVIVYTMAIGGVQGVSLQGEQMLRRIAQETGGRAFFPWNAKEVAAAHRAIAEDAQHRYRVTYTPLNQRHDGAWRVIRLATSNPDYKVVARAGYLSPPPKPVKATMEFTIVDELRDHVEVGRDDLVVLEDGVAQRVESFHEAVAPVSVMLALDASGSMTRVVPAVQEAAHTFVDALRPDDPLGILVFADRAEMVHDLTPARWVSHRAVQAYAVKGGTALYDALVESMTRLQTVEGRRVVVVMTDGRDENAASTGPGSSRGWEDVLTLARASGVTVYAIGLGARMDGDRLQQLAALTGGEAYFTSDMLELGKQYQRIVDELHRRYVLAYTSTNTQRNGAWRKVELSVPKTGLRVRSTGGYYAPAQ